MSAHASTSAPSRYPVRPVPADTLEQLRRQDDAGRSTQPFVATTDGTPVDCVGSPLRCCFRPIQAGELVALVSYAPLRRWAATVGAQPGAYDETGPIFIHAEPCHAPEPRADYPFVRPGALRTLRRYDGRGHIVGGRLVELSQQPSDDLDHALHDAFADPSVALVHVRAVEYGCFHFEVREPDLR